MKRRPNILLVTTDQQAATAMSCAGSQELSTPAMDSIAARGTRFENAYCTFPLCSPSRASMFTGLYPHQAGVTKNGMPLAPAAAAGGLGRILSAAGYDCVYGGKWHLPKGDIEDGVHGFRRIAEMSDLELSGKCVEYLRGRDRATPFFMVASFDNPHNICEWSRCQPLPWGEIEDVPTEWCPDLPANLAVAPYEAQFVRTEMSQFPGAFEAPPGVDDSWWRHYRHAYFRLVEKADAQIARILTALEEAGLVEETAVIFTSDHGEGAGAHGWKKKRFLFEEAVRVPLVIALPGVTEGSLSDRLVSNGLDLVPTVCELAGAPLPQGLSGRSLLPLLAASEEPWQRDQLVAVTRGGRMVRTRRYKYVAYSWGLYREQLFDMERDRGEMVNLAVNRRYAPQLEEHRRRLAAWIEETGDPFMNRRHPQAYEGVTTGV